MIPSRELQREKLPIMVTRQGRSLVLPATTNSRIAPSSSPLFYNAQGYNIHPLIQEVTQQKYGWLLKGIPNSRENFLNFTIIPPIEVCPISITDNLQFLSVHCPPLWEHKRKSSQTKAKDFCFPIMFSLQQAMKRITLSSSSRRTSFSMCGSQLGVGTCPWRFTLTSHGPRHHMSGSTCRRI